MTRLPWDDGGVRALALLFVLAGCDAVLLPDEKAFDPSTRFGAPVALSGINTGDEEDRPTLADDMLELVFHRAARLWVTTRVSVDEDFGSATQITALDPITPTTGSSVRACLSHDGLGIYFSRRELATDTFDIFHATRASRADAWGTPVKVVELSSVEQDYCGSESADGTQMYLSQGGRLKIATRAQPTDPWGTPVVVTAIETASQEFAIWATADKRVIVFDRETANINGVWMAVDTGGSFTMRQLDEIAVDGNEEGSPWISPDGRTLFFTVNIAGHSDLYTARR